MNVTWEHTVIGGRTAPEDFAAKDCDRTIGRAYLHHSGAWYWCVNASGAAARIVRPASYPLCGHRRRQAAGRGLGAARL
jgi:hypothetical protein